MNVSCNYIVFLRNVRRLLVTANVVPSSPILVTPMIEARRSSERLFLQERHDVTSQKTAFFIVTAMKLQIIHSINRLGSVAET
jgi:hypothetical protein